MAKAARLMARSATARWISARSASADVSARPASWKLANATVSAVRISWVTVMGRSARCGDSSIVKADAHRVPRARRIRSVTDGSAAWVPPFAVSVPRGRRGSPSALQRAPMLRDFPPLRAMRTDPRSDRTAGRTSAGSGSTRGSRRACRPSAGRGPRSPGRSWSRRPGTSGANRPRTPRRNSSQTRSRHRCSCWKSNRRTSSRRRRPAGPFGRRGNWNSAAVRCSRAPGKTPAHPR